MGKNPIRKHHLEEYPVCHTCKSKIEDPTFRILIVKDKIFYKHKRISFHYFFPCWDIEYVCKNLKDYEIFRAGFCCDKSLLSNPMSINNLRKNSDLWDIEIST